MQLKVGQKVRIHGDREDFTEQLDGKIGFIVKVNENDCLVDVPTTRLVWWIWNYNMEVVENV